MKKGLEREGQSSTKILGDLGVSSLDVHNEGSLKPKKARSAVLSSILSGSKSSAVLVCQDSQEEEVCVYIMRNSKRTFPVRSGLVLRPSSSASRVPLRKLRVTLSLSAY